MDSSRRWLIVAGASIVIATGTYFLQQHLEYVEVHTLPPRLAGVRHQRANPDLRTLEGHDAEDPESPRVF